MRSPWRYLLVLIALFGVVQAQQDSVSLRRSASKGDKSALAQLRTLADKGDASAQVELGSLYMSGEGVPRDFAQGGSWIRKAAEQGYAVAQNIMGALSEKAGYADQAVNWYRKAAERGFAAAQSNLGAMYATGEGVPKDFVTAYMWRNLAAAQGEEPARIARDELEKGMTPEQIAEAQRLSREWKPKSNIPRE